MNIYIVDITKSAKISVDTKNKYAGNVLLHINLYTGKQHNGNVWGLVIGVRISVYRILGNVSQGGCRVWTQDPGADQGYCQGQGMVGTSELNWTPYSPRTMCKGRTTLTLAWTDRRLSYQKQNIYLIRSLWTVIALWFCTLDLRSNVNVVDAYNTRTYHIHIPEQSVESILPLTVEIE